MTTTPVEANVVLTADNSQYDQSMEQSSQATGRLASSVDTLGSKISKLTKVAGKSLIGISATDVGLITASVTAWNSYEKQMARLQSQSAVLTQTQSSQSRVMKDYTTAVKGLRAEYGSTTSEAAKLVETLSKVTNIRQSRDLTDLSKVFMDMSHATGESSEGLASSLSNLQKIMGSKIDSQNTRQYADMFTYLSAQTNTTAQGLIDFTAQLAPTGEAMGMNIKQVAGFATAFSKAGQEGLGASTLFTKITTDISRAVAGGGPELQQYANIVGGSADQFAALVKSNPKEAVDRIFEALSAQGDQAQFTIERLGIEGLRGRRALAAVMNQPGGLRAAGQQAEIGSKSNAAAEGAAASMRSLTEEFGKFGEQMKMIAETLGAEFIPMIEKVAGVFTKVAENVNTVMQGPLGEFLGWVMKIVAPLAGTAGGLLLFAGAILKIAAAFAVWRNSAMLGMREGFRGGGPIGSATVGMRGEQLATDPRSSWLQRGMYNVGQPVGSVLGGAFGMIRSGYQGGRGWADPNYVPGGRGVPTLLQRARMLVQPGYEPPVGGPRSLLSYAAGGLGRGLEQFINPQFDQMRYANPAARKTWLANQSPLASWQDRRALSGKMGDVAGAEEALKNIRQQEAAIKADPYTATAIKDAQLQQLKASREQTKELLNSARASERVTREAINGVTAQRRLNAETAESATGLRRWSEGLKGFGAGMGGGLLGAGRAGMSALARSGMGWQMGGMLGMAGMAGAGVQSNTLMLGAMGSMMGPWGAAGGAAIGAGLDIAHYNDDITKNLDALNEGIVNGGSQFTGMADALKDSHSELEDWQAKIVKGKREGTWYPTWGDLGADVGGIKNWISGWSGPSDSEELQANIDKSQAEYQNRRGVALDMARRAGTTFHGSTDARLEQLESFMTDKGAARLSAAGVTYDDLVKAREAGGKEYANMIQKVMLPGQAVGLWDRLTAGGGTGATMVGTPTGQKALLNQDDVAAQYASVNEIFQTAMNSGADFTEVMKQSQGAMKSIGVENQHEYEIQMAVFNKAQQAQQIQMSTETRVGAFQTQVTNAQQLLGNLPNTPSGQAQGEQLKTQTEQAFADQVNYFKSLLLAQDQYELSRSRAQDDYHTQRTYQEYDYNLSRTRAEESYDRGRARSVEDYYRSVRQATFDYNLQRSRAEADFNHQVQIAAEQQAQSMYNIYERVQTQRTASPGWLLSNATDQLERMQQQEQDLNKVRKMGLSDTVIQQLGFTDPANQQTLARFVTQLTPKMISEFNKTAGTERTKAAKDLFTDKSSLEWQELRRGFKLNLSRTSDDFERQMTQNRHNFHRGLDRLREDYDISMAQQAEDYHTGMTRQAHQYHLSMDRAAEDMANYAKEIDMDMEQVLRQSVNRLSGHAQEQARAVLDTYKGLKNDTDPVAIEIMQSLSNIFGFTYQIPKGASTGSESLDNLNRHNQTAGMHTGGVVPGWNPGRDTHTIGVGGGEGILRPEATRAVGGEKAIAAINHAAIHGMFAKGGVFWPVPGHDTGTYPGHDGVDINRGSGWDDYGDPIRAFRSGKIVYVGSAHGYGDAIFENTSAANVVYGHTSAQFVRAGQSVIGGQLIGKVGSTGNSSAPHLHFGIPGGTYEQAMALLAGAIVGGGPSGFAPSGAANPLVGLLKKLYAGPEHAAYRMQGMHPLFHGDISTVINRYGRRAINKMRAAYGDPVAAASGNIGDQPYENMDNVNIVRVGAKRMGWLDQWPQLRELVEHESGFNNNAQNPTSSAYGMFQFLDGTWGTVGGHKTSDPWMQTKYGLKYIADRYSNPMNAWQKWQSRSPHWYGDGSIFTSPNMIGVGERGPEAVIPLNARGGEFLGDAMARSIGMGGTPVRGGGMNLYQTRVDRSTNFSGPITVQANDPMELIAKLKARQRVMALSQPALTGSAA